MALPGVSGGTMAFIMGIYEKLIWEISKTRMEHFKKIPLFLTFKKSQIQMAARFFRSAWDWSFLIPLGLGAVSAAALFVAFASPLIEKYSLEFYSIIFGLTLASTFKPFKDMQKSARTAVLFFVSFTANILCFAFGKSFFLFPQDLPAVVFLPVGFVIAMALMVPGVSGSYLLLIFGLYEKTLLSLKQGEFSVICFFLIGVAMGVFSTARLMRKMIKNYFNETMAVILGLILSGLYAIYPLPKGSAEEWLSPQTEIFLFYAIMSLCAFVALSFFYEKKANFPAQARLPVT